MRAIALRLAFVASLAGAILATATASPKSPACLFEPSALAGSGCGFPALRSPASGFQPLGL